MAKNLVTPIGRFLFPHLREPDTAFNKDGVYTVTLSLCRSDAEELMKQIDAVSLERAEEYAEELNKKKGTKKQYTPEEALAPTKSYSIRETEYLPLKSYRVGTDGEIEVAEVEDTEEVLFKFKTKAVWHSPNGTSKVNSVSLYDGQNNLLPEDFDIHSGWIGRIGFALVPFASALSKGAGCSLRLYSVQCLLEPKRSTGFDSIGGGYSTAKAAEKSDEGDKQDGSANADGDEAPCTEGGDY